MRVNFNQEILISLLDQFPDVAITLDKKFPKYNKWIEKSDKPSILQLQKVANVFRVPFGYFFLKDIPQKEFPIPHFRTSDKESFTPSLELFDTINTLLERQDWARDIMRELIDDKLSFANSITEKTPIKEAASLISSLLDLPGGWASTMPRWYDALTMLIKKTEDAGIFVVKNGVVNNNTHRKLDIKEFRGFVLYDNYAPFVFINSNDFITGNIFTLIHEIAHVLIGKSASFDLRGLQPADDRIETYCDKIAAEFLTPEEQINEQLNEVGPDYNRLARIFKVSQIVIARRLLDLKHITLSDFYIFYNDHKNDEINKSPHDGGNFYYTVPYRLSVRFFQIVYNQVSQNKMLFSDAFRITGLKSKTFDTYVRDYLK